ncbi:hypothetical protein SAMN02745163_02328 [Clostridium cavendishii DSM 21758]|uniref:Uncharacterized protein n=1 Tax=Clostridium cavendishii DSM 21758 TaxID=1121302 RepID=A0A1M6KXP5_9CLOT|nr:hypothetical protein [Clostridium cavendishii]SHJ63727.1 hypothetical protein SAMN02745163_02328 [Clostridium cavendishii DSM 21758]
MYKVIGKGSSFYFTSVGDYILEKANLSGNEQIVYVHLKNILHRLISVFKG